MIQTANYANCADLDAPELFIVINHTWAQENEAAIRSTKGVELNLQNLMFFIPDAKDRLLFALRWP